MKRNFAIGIAIVVIGVAFAAFYAFSRAERRMDEPTKALLAAVGKRDSVAIENAFAAGADPNAGFFGRNLLLEAAKDGDAFVARALLSHGADPNVRSKWGRTPLHEAALYGHLEIARLLVQNGANVNAQNPRGETPLFYAEQGLAMGPKRTEKHAEVAAFLRKQRMPAVNGSNRPQALPASVFRPKGCEYSVAFARSPEVSDTNASLFEHPTDGKLAMLSVPGGKGFFRAECYPVSGKLTAQVTKEHAYKGMRMVAEAAGIRDFQLSYSEGEAGKMCELRGSKVLSDQKGGEIRLIANWRTYYGEASVFSVMMIGPSDKFPSAEQISFRDSISRAGRLP